MKYKLLALSFALLAIACGGTDNPETTPEEVPGPALLSTDPADGISELTGTSLSIVFTFDQNIVCTPEGQAGVSVDSGSWPSLP